MDNRIRDIALQILKLELKLREPNGDINNIISQMQTIAENLTPEEMDEVDNYIQQVMKKCSME